MSKYFKSIAFFFLVIFFMSSYNSDDKEQKNTTNSLGSTAMAANINATVTPETKTAVLPDMLDTLWADADDFKKLRGDRKLVFSFTLRDPDKLTLWGWQCANGSCKGTFPDMPNIQLKNGGAHVKRGPNAIFGNIVILKKNNDMQKLKDAIKAFKYVVFLPEMYGEFIKYKIFVTNEKPGFVKVLALEPTGVETNPSPPKNNTSN